MKFTEAKPEKAFTELLENENFPHQLGNTISRSVPPQYLNLKRNHSGISSR